MSARGGARAKGTDGSDFGHRETVASHYQIRFLLLFQVIPKIYALKKCTYKFLFKIYEFHLFNGISYNKRVFLIFVHLLEKLQIPGSNRKERSFIFTTLIKV